MGQGHRRFEPIRNDVDAGAGTTRICARRSPSQAAGSPVVLIPGLGLSGRSMLPLAELLLSQREVLVVDPPGCGESARPARRLDLGAQAALWSAWAAERGLERVIWVGHSFGSQVVVELAARHPERIEQLVLISPTVDPRSRTMGAQLARLLHDAVLEPPSLIRMLVSEYVSAGPRALFHAGRIAVRDRIETKLPTISAPTLVISGERDPLVSCAWAAQVASLLPRGRLVVVPGAPHAVHYVAARVVAEAIDEFCETPETGPARSASAEGREP